MVSTLDALPARTTLAAHRCRWVRPRFWPPSTGVLASMRNAWPTYIQGDTGLFCVRLQHYANDRISWLIEWSLMTNLEALWGDFLIYPCTQCADHD